MKKVFLSFVFLSVLSFGANAATLTLTKEDPDATDLANMAVNFGGTGQLVSGSGQINGSPIDHIWGIESNPEASYVSSFSITTPQATAIIDGVNLYADSSLTTLLVAATQVGPEWKFSYLLAANTQYFINVLAHGTGSYTLNVQTPIPAAVWLFGSALMGLVGFSRRKGNSAQSVA
ncbi:hypothetical protein [Methylobacter sp. BBA5.1]|uniref:hypothetical protein n=1 Tax=Methylobacter sp. BBA5.1 TaxID=1495064 RepID=UPI0009DF2861|nr:hypothetical protein [Methylobacter sp. BBA5.1]